jgi:hypothetical protein
LPNNIIKLENYRKNKNIEDYYDSSDELIDPVVIGWTEAEDGERELHIVSSVDTVPCLWMIELAQKIVEGRPPEIIRNDNE